MSLHSVSSVIAPESTSDRGGDPRTLRTLVPSSQTPDAVAVAPWSPARKGREQNDEAATVINCQLSSISHRARNITCIVKSKTNQP